MLINQSTRDNLYQQLRLHEGLVLKSYRDTKGILTIGIGHNLEAHPAEAVLGRKIDEKGITETEAMKLFNDDLDRCIKQVETAIVKFHELSEPRQQVLIDMAFNLGGDIGLLKFKKMLTALTSNDFATAAAEMLNSKWATQVGNRSKRLALMMKENISFAEACTRISA